MALHSSILAQRIPWTERLVGQRRTQLKQLSTHSTMLISYHTTLFSPKDKLFIVHVCAQSLQSYMILCGPMGSNTLGSTVHGSFLQEY